MLGYSPKIYPILIADCANFHGALQAGCYRWLGKALGVLTDGKFERTGCPLMPSPAGRRACVQGVRTMNGPLETFS